MCKESYGTEEEFVRAVEATPEPMCVLATNQQLSDMERFCTGEESSVASIDPTFNLGPFSVAPSYNLPQLIGKNNQEWKPSHFAWACFSSSNQNIMTLSLFCINIDPVKS